MKCSIKAAEDKEQMENKTVTNTVDSNPTVSIIIK